MIIRMESFFALLMLAFPEGVFLVFLLVFVFFRVSSRFEAGIGLPGFSTVVSSFVESFSFTGFSTVFLTSEGGRNDSTAIFTREDKGF